MIKGFYSAVSAMITNLNRQTALTHNIDNLETPGFKQILVSMDDFKDTPVNSIPDGTSQASLPAVLQNQGLDRLNYLGPLGLGVQTMPDKTDFNQGGIEVTGNPLDLAISGNGFFRVKTAKGDRYTRDGRFLKDAGGNLVTVDGNQVCGDSGGAIKLPEGEVAVAQNGTITVDGKSAGKIGLLAFKEPQKQLTREGQNLYVASGNPDGTDKGTIQQGALEGANVDVARLTADMVATTRAYEAAQQMVKMQDDLLGQALGTLGKV